MGPNSRNLKLPSELCWEILSYLPVKSLLRFRSVLKEWKSIIDNADFASLHLCRYLDNCLESRLIVLEEHDNVVSDPRARLCSRRRKLDSDPETLESVHIPVPPFIPDCLTDGFLPKIIGNVNGLLLVQSYPAIGIREIYLWNPSIRKSLNIPLPPSGAESSELFLGFDQSTNDYKIVSICAGHDEHRQPPPLDIFSLHTRSWKRGSFTGAGGKPFYLIGLGARNVSSEGSSVHFIVFDRWEHRGEFVSFNVTSETVSYTRLPRYDYKKFDDPVLVTGFLTGFLINFDEIVDIWVLEKDYSWSRKFRLDVLPWGFDIWGPCYFMKNSVFTWGSCYSTSHVSAICFYNTSTGTKSVVPDCNWSAVYIGAYKESLLLLS